LTQKEVHCAVCGAPLVYLTEAEPMTCALCGRTFSSRARCENGHFLCDSCHTKDAEEAAFLYCLHSSGRDPIALMQALMRLPAVHMHGPEHHFLVPCTLLCAYHNSGGKLGDLKAALKEAIARGKTVPGGMCGFYGACGAAVGAGIFLSVALDATPLSGDSFGLCNRITACALEKIGAVGGPRCCKRNSFLAIEAAAAFTAENLGVQMELPGKIRCAHSPKNAECLFGRCPYFPR
jgi:hypothetical protein